VGCPLDAARSMENPVRSFALSVGPPHGQPVGRSGNTKRGRRNLVWSRSLTALCTALLMLVLLQVPAIAATKVIVVPGHPYALTIRAFQGPPHSPIVPSRPTKIVVVREVWAVERAQQLLNELDPVRHQKVSQSCPAGPGFYDVLRFWYHDRPSLLVHVDTDTCRDVFTSGKVFALHFPFPRINIYTYIPTLLARPGK
jgi:hypothetical protein